MGGGSTLHIGTLLLLISGMVYVRYSFMSSIWLWSAGQLRIFFYDVQYFLLTFLVVCIFCNFLQFAIKWHDAWPMFFAQVTLRDLFMYLVFVSWCDNVHIFYSWLGTWSIHVLMYLYLSLIFIRMFFTNLGGNVKQYSMTEKKW